MKNRNSGERIIWLLKLLISLGVLMIAINIALTSWSLVKFRNERIRALNEQNTVSRLTSEIRKYAFEAKASIQNLLSEDTHISDENHAAVEKLDKFIHSEMPHMTNIEVSHFLDELNNSSDLLTQIHERAHVWRTIYDSINEDLSQQKTSLSIRKEIARLRNELEMQEGKLRLQEALLYKKALSDKSKDAYTKSQLAAYQIRSFSLMASDLKSELAEFSRMVELLNGEESLDNLPDIKANNLFPMLDRLKYNVKLLEESDIVGQSPATFQILNNISALLFGEEETGIPIPEDIAGSRNGLFNLRKNFLQLRKERFQLRNDIETVSQRIEETEDKMNKLPSLRSETFAQTMEESLSQNRTKILIIGICCIIPFLWLGWFISVNIKEQVHEIESARREAEESHSATQKLLAEQQKAAEEIKAAHKELQASEQRYRQLSASAPIGIFEITIEGTCLYTNPQWQKITGFSLGQSFGTGWMQVIHPDDMPKFLKWKETVNETTDFELEFRILTIKKEVLWVHTYITAICSISGNVIGYVGTIENITDRKLAAEELDKANKKLVDISRQAGMAEIATDVLHNIGNVLNSVNVSLTLIAEHLRKSKLPNLVKLNEMIQGNLNDLGNYLANDPKGKQIAPYLKQLTEHLSNEQNVSLTEIKQLEKNLDHIKDIVTMQQNYAKVSGVTEIVRPVDLIEDALHMHLSSLTRHDIQIIKNYGETPSITTDKHKVLQILVNLIANAKHACDETKNADKKIVLDVFTREDKLIMSVKDNGIGIKPEYISRIFAHGFTTRKHGHGFGLHSGALTAKELGGSLTVQSEGENMGAAFVLELPLKISQMKSELV